MTTTPILRQLPMFPDLDAVPKKPENKPNLHTFWLHQEMLPVSITSSPPAMRTLDLLGALHWGDLPERNLERDWGQPTISNAALIIAELVKLNEGFSSFGVLYRYPQEHTAFISLCGFPLCSVPATGLSFNTRTHLPVQPTSPAISGSSCIYRIFCSKVGLLTIKCRLASPCPRKA